MTLCNMSIEAGGRCGMVAPDATTFAYLKDRRSRRRATRFEQAVRGLVGARNPIRDARSTAK